MEIVTTVMYFVGIIVFLLMMSYTFFTRRTINFFTHILKRKQYVVCHMRYANTNYEDVYNVVPESDFLTKVKNFSYDLNPKYSIFSWKNRLHFILDENNSIPKHFEKDTEAEIMFQAMEIQNALDNDVTKYLFTKRKEILIVGLFMLGIIAVIAILYSIMRMNEVIEKLNAIKSAAAP